ncbi:LOW QUALITY PROTEIN: hypothetical protein HID58_070908 [Brassica napus]|uniref:Uncharacterized protein n=1 Tax=Brassica napus TaxID=3708 RepID=A0ABQ7Z071_BRANA|nr:LOW QUALITY PROTEIN: hypothetical protein HID58_070908 [Brassica napus]
MVVYPAQTIFLSIVGCKLLQLMRKRFTWKLDQSMRIRIQVLLLEPSSLLMILCDASVIGLCGYIYKKFMVVVSADVKGYRGIAFLDSFFILFASYTDSLYAGARIMEKQHSIMIFKVFFCLHHSSCSYFSFDFIQRYQCSCIMYTRPLTFTHPSHDRESKIDPSDASGRMLDNVKGDIEHCHTLIVNTSGKFSAKIASEEERKMWING